MGDTLSIKVYQALASALDLNPSRRIVLSDNGNFPSDLYIAQGLLGSLGRGLELKIVEPEEVEDAIDDSIAVLMLTEVDYRTGRLHDMKALTAKAHAKGALTVWDLAHSAGALPVDVEGANADFAVGCTYKYLNGGPGAPAFIYVAPRHAQTARPALSGWLGHEAPFAFDLDIAPATASSACASARRRSSRWPHSTPRSTSGMAFRWTTFARASIALADLSSAKSRRAARNWCWPRRATAHNAAARSPSATRTATPSCRR